MRVPAGRIFLASFPALVFAPALCGLDFSERSVSPSGQFIVYGADSKLRGSVSALAERTKATLLSLLKESDNSRIAIVINLQARAVNLPEMPETALRFSQTETGLKLQLDLILSRKMSPTAIQREVARAILLEMIYRNQTDVSVGDVLVDPPAWLLDGLLESASNCERPRLAVSLSTPASLPTLCVFLNQDAETLDSTSRQLYRAYSFVLVQALIDSPTGPRRLGDYVRNLPFASNDAAADLGASFPEIRDLNRAWKSKAQELRASFERELLNFAQTDQKLNELITGPLWNERDKPVTIENISLRKLNPAHRTALREFSAKLLLLAARANPVLRPVIRDYQQIANQMVFGKIRGIAKRFAELKMLRARLSARMSCVDDYLNWFEVAKMETPSGIFEDSRETTPRNRQKPKRHDPLSTYLDAMELEF